MGCTNDLFSLVQPFLVVNRYLLFDSAVSKLPACAVDV